MIAKIFCFGYIKWKFYLSFSVLLINTKHTMHLNALVEKLETSTSTLLPQTTANSQRGTNYVMPSSLVTIIQPLEKRSFARRVFHSRSANHLYKQTARLRITFIQIPFLQTVFVHPSLRYRNKLLLSPPILRNSRFTTASLTTKPIQRLLSIPAQLSTFVIL